MALSNSSIQEVHNMNKSNGDIKSLAIGSHHENSNPNFEFQNMTDDELDHHHNQHQMCQSLINFKCGMDNIFHKNNESLLSFEPQGVCDEDTYNWDQQRLMDDPNCFQTATNNWLYCEGAVVSDANQEADVTQEISNQKRQLVGESSGGVCKKQCVGAAKKQKPKSSTAKDPQSIAAKNRRERISERLKILQELVPNGSKVDLVTMLEKAISYVKFLQVQVKILASDEFWPVQGGKAPDISQVKEAIDAILSSQRERSSSSNSEK